jgi:hypothetical protein
MDNTKVINDTLRNWQDARNEFMNAMDRLRDEASLVFYGVE